MTVVLSILLAALVGGVCFLLIDRWQRGSSPAEPAAPELWTPSTPTPPATTSLFIPPSANAPAPFRESYEERTEPLPPSRGLWDDPRRDEDDDDQPRGLWSGWAR